MSLDEIRTLLAGASETDDRHARIVYTATARALIARLRAELDQVDAQTKAVEVEIGRTSRDVTQLPREEREP